MTETITEIPGIRSSEPNPDYQRYIFNLVWKAILLGTRDPNTKRPLIRNQDIVEALIQVQAMILSSSADAKVPSHLAKHCERFAKQLRGLTQGLVDEELRTGEPIFDSLIDPIKSNH